MTGRKPSTAELWIAAWVTAATAVTFAFLGIAGLPEIDPVKVVLAVLSTGAADALHLRFWWGEESGDFSFTEVAIAANLLLLPPTWVLVATALGIGFNQTMRGFEARKVVFNAGQVTTSAAAALLLLIVFPDTGPLIEGRPAFGAALGMSAYAAVNLTALSGIVARLSHQSSVEVIREHGRTSLVAAVGNTSVGILAAHVATSSPGLLPFLLAPLFALHLSYKGVVDTQNLLSQLRVEHQRMDRVVLGTSDGILLLDGRAVVEVWNSALQRMTGVRDSDAVGRPVSEVLTPRVRHGDGEVRGRWLLDQARPTEPTQVHEAVLVDADGVRRFVRESHTFLFDDRGRCTGDVVLVNDITRERELDAMKGDFVARVSHELRTPLTPIKGFAEVLVARGDRLQPEQRRDAARSIAERAKRMTALVEDLLLVARLDAEGPASTVEPEPLVVAGLVEGVAADVRTQHPERQIHVFATPDAGKALADRVRLRQVLTNVLDNAVRYSPVETPVEVTIDRDGDDVLVGVKDRGPGIPRDKQDAIFERFHRLEDPLRMQTGGVGLGLFIARRLTEAMHGKLTVHSRLGEGSTFTVRLPSAEPTQGALPALPAPEDGRTV